MATEINSHEMEVLSPQTKRNIIMRDKDARKKNRILRGLNRYALFVMIIIFLSFSVQIMLRDVLENHEYITHVMKYEKLVLLTIFIFCNFKCDILSFFCLNKVRFFSFSFKIYGKKRAFSQVIHTCITANFHFF